MRKIYIKNLLLIIFAVLSVDTLSAQQLPNPGFEDWGGEKFDGKEQPASWYVSNIEQVGIKFNLTHKESGHSGSYSLMVQDTKVGALGITEVSPGYFSLGKPWSHLEGIDTKTATAGTSGGIKFNYRPDSMSVWVKRTGNNVDKEDFYLLYYAWSGTAKGSKYKAKNGGCTSISQTNEESDIRLALDANDCGTDQKANQIAEGMWREKKEYGQWTNIRVPIYYFSNDVPEMMNIIFSASNYPNYRANSGLYEGNSLYIDDVQLIYSSKIQKLYIGGKEWGAFDPNSTEEQVYSMSREATAIPTIKAYRGAGELTNARGDKATFNGRELTGKEITITPGELDGAATIITVTAEDGSSTTTYRIRFAREASKNTKLKNILVNGTGISNFQPGIYNYTVELPYGTTTIPEVTALTQEDEQTVSITQSSSTTGKATILVTAADKTSTATYVVQFKVAQLSDNTLKDIKVNGISIAGFSPSQTKYRVSLPTTTTTIPTVEAISAYPAGEQTITHTPPTSAAALDGSEHSISVTTPGNPTPRTYKLTYKLEASSYSLLKNLQMGDNLITNFDPNQFTYYVNLPIGTTQMPTITYEKGESTQTVTVQEGGLNGVSKVTVVAGNNVDKSEYKIVVSTAKSEISSLNMIYVGGQPLEGFEPTKTTYTYTLPIGTTELPDITVEKGDEYQKVNITTGGINGTTRIAVTAENGNSTIYQITFSVFKATNATLKMIYLDGQPLEGFDPSILEYNCPLPQGTTEMPVITYDQADEYQTVTVRSGGVNGDYRITVRPQSGASQTYVLHFSVATSDNASLKMIYLDGQPLEGFHPDTLHYIDTLPMGVYTIPTVTYDKGHEAQKVLSICSQTIQTIKVTAENGKTITYTIQFVIQRSNSAFLKMIYLDGDSLAGFDKNTFEYTVSLKGNTCPVITVDKEEGQQITITSPYAAGQAEIVVTPQGGSSNTYIINFVNLANNSALLKNIYVDGVAIPRFQPEVFEYDVVANSTNPTITYDAEATQSVSIFRQKDIITLYVVAGNDKVQYQLNLNTTANTDCTLRNITADGTTLDGFASNLFHYTITVGHELPVIAYEKQYAEQTVYAGMLDANTYSLLVRAQSGDTARYTLEMERTLSDDANLINLIVEGYTIDFQPTTYTYNIDLPMGYDLPDLKVETKEGQSTAMHIVSSTEQQVVVTAENGNTNTYRILYNRPQSSNAYLSTILIDGDTLAGFDPTVYHYTDTLAWRTKYIPCVQPVGMHEHQTITTYHSAVDGTTKIYVLAADGTTSLEYSIDFPVVKSDNLGLEYLILDHETLEIDFQEDITDYTIQLPYGEHSAPLVLYQALEPEQTIEYISRPLGQTSQIIVIAENGDQRIYNLHFEPTYATESNRLASLSIAETGATLDVNATTHTITLPFGTRTMTIDYTKAYQEQTVWIQPGGVTAPTIITVKANRPGEEDVIYTINPIVDPQDPAVLTDIKVNGVTIEGFDANRFSYIVNVTNAPVVAYTAAPGAQVNILMQTTKHWQAQVTYNGRTNIYNVWYYYENDQVPNTEFTEWTKCETFTSADKPAGWYTVADVLGKHSGFGSFEPDGMVNKSGNDAVFLKTPYSSPGGGNIPGFITLGNVTAKWGVAGSSSFGISGGISFHNTPDQVAIRYYNQKVKNHSLIQYSLTGTHGVKTLEWKDSETRSDYKEVTFDLSEANQTAGDPTLLNITICSFNSIAGTTNTALNTLAEMYVDYLRFSYNSTLTSLKVNDSVAVKDANAFSYTLPDSENTLIPTLAFTGEVADQAQKVIWSNEIKEGGYGVRNATITNYAEDGTSTQYTLTIYRPLDTRNLLSDLRLNGTTITAFDPNVTEYVYTLASNQNLPDIQPIANGGMQTITTNYADSTMTILVQPETGEATTYTVRFVKNFSSDIELANITVEGTDIAFNPTQKEYTITASKMPTITFIKKMDSQTVDLRNGVLTVTAENGNVGTYTILLNQPSVTTTGQLAMIELNGVEMQGFSSTTYDYTLQQPSTTTFQRINESDSVIFVQTPLYMEWQVYGSEQHTYRITYPSTLSSNTAMDSLLINGTLLEGFNPSIYTYEYETNEPVHIHAVANLSATHMDADIEQQGDTTIYTYTITAEDGTVGAPYTLSVLPALSSLPYLEGIYVDGQLLQDFRPDSLHYTYIIPAGEYKSAEPAIPSITYLVSAPRQHVSIEYGELGQTTTLLVVSEDGSTQQAYELYIEAEDSHCTALTGIAVNGQPINNFDSSRHFYSVKSNEPSINLMWSSNDNFQTVIESHSDFVHTLHVIAQDGVSTADYIVEVYQETASADVTLADILLDGKSFENFHPTLNEDLIFSPMQQRYNINLPSGTLYLPEVSALLNAEGQKVEILIDGWEVDIIVTAPDGTSTNTYTLRFFAPMSSNTQLKMIYLDGEQLSSFLPTTYKYDILLPTGQETMPDVYAEPMEATQTVLDSITGNLQHTIYVTAEDGTTSQYYLSFILNPSQVDTLAAIYGDGELIEGFKADSFYYAYTLPVGTDHIPALTWDAADQWQTITATKALDTPTKQITQIQVVAGSGKKNVYTVEYTIALSAVDTLEMIYVQAQELEGFDAHTLDYHIYMAAGDTLVPAINWKEGDLYQEVNLHVQPLNLNQEHIGWKQTLEVTAQDGSRRLYTLYFYFTYPLSTNTDLLNIYLNGVALPSFHPAQYSYRVSVEEGLGMPAILVEKAEAAQTVRIDTIDGNAVITVWAEDTTYQSTYTIQFDYKKSSYSYLAGIYQDGQLIDGFEPTIFEYHIVLPYGTTQMPTFTYEPGKEGQTIEVEAIQAQRTTTYIITVTAPDEEAASTYTLQVEIALNDNSALASLVVKGVALEGFDPETTEYLITYPVGTNESEYATTQDIEATPQDANATVTISQNGTDIIIQVTAEDGVTTTIYTISQSVYQSSNALLIAIYINDQLIRDFDPEVFEYEYYVTYVQPTIVAVAQDSTATIEYGFYEIDAPFYIYVTAEDGTELVYTIYFKLSTIPDGSGATALDVLMKHIPGSRELVFATTRNNISVAVYNSDGQLLFMSEVPASNQNDVVLMTNAAGQTEIVDIYTPQVSYTMPLDNEFYFYVFYEDGKRRVETGKLLFTR
ncbi:MAG: hypothetical protein J6R26_01340 [Paludibacteraceae bacterium]|nr:hypothetical protein [Paludibacteraceae bacterium]